jgi:hypothetical protein
MMLAKRPQRTRRKDITIASMTLLVVDINGRGIGIGVKAVLTPGMFGQLLPAASLPTAII